MTKETVYRQPHTTAPAYRRRQTVLPRPWVHDKGFFVSVGEVGIKTYKVLIPY